MLCAVMIDRIRLAGAGLVAAAALLAGCTSTTSGHGAAEVPTTAASSTPDFPIAPATSEPPTETTTQAASTSATSTIHPAPPAPVRTVTVNTHEGTPYVVKIWWDVQDRTCFDHAYGSIVNFLTSHPCSGLERFLATTTVNGRPVGFAESETGFPGTSRNLYGEAGKFAELEQADGTGSLNDLLREGYRLPSGPTSVPAGEAFNVLGQDQGVTVWDAWYLDGPTPTNDQALIKMTQDLFLQF
jgi:predicted small secreted protein